MESGQIQIKADTIAELAEKLGVPADKLQESVDGYNAAYEAGKDVKFDVPAQFLSEIKTAPFCATPVVCSVLTIPFGLHVNDDSQVCTEEDEPIDGPFAVGNVQGDFFGLNYPVHCPGVSHGRCLTFGQLVGEALATDTVITKLEFKQGRRENDIPEAAFPPVRRSFKGSGVKPGPFCGGLHGENDSMKVDSSSAACHRAYTRSANLYPTRHTVSRYFGCEGLSSIFSRILRMNTVMLLSSTLLSRPQMCS